MNILEMAWLLGCCTFVAFTMFARSLGAPVTALLTEARGFGALLNGELGVLSARPYAPHDIHLFKKYPDAGSFGQIAQYDEVVDVSAEGRIILVLMRSGVLLGCGGASQMAVLADSFAPFQLEYFGQSYLLVQFATLVKANPFVGRIVRLISSQKHSFFFTSNGHLFAAGNNDFGQLGNEAVGFGFSSDSRPPVFVNFSTLLGRPWQTTRVRDAGAGGHHSLIQLESGEIFSMGLNSRGQLCRWAPPHSFTLGQLADDVLRLVNVSVITAGGNETVHITAGGRSSLLWTPTRMFICTSSPGAYVQPVPMPYLRVDEGERIVEVKAEDMFVARTSWGRLLTRLDGSCALVCRPCGGSHPDSTVFAPADLAALDPYETVLGVATGPGALGARTNQSRVLICGRNPSGLLARPGVFESATLQPAELTPLLPGEAIVGLAFSRYGAVFTSHGRLIAWGRPNEGQICNEQTMIHRERPLEIIQPILDSYLRQEVAQRGWGRIGMIATSEGTLIWVGNDVFSFGSNQQWRLARPTDTDQEPRAGLVILAFSIQQRIREFLTRNRQT